MGARTKADKNTPTLEGQGWLTSVRRYHLTDERCQSELIEDDKFK